MKEIEIKNNPQGIKVYINGVPNFSLMPETELNLLVGELTEQALKYMDKKQKRHRQKTEKNIPDTS